MEEKARTERNRYYREYRAKHPEKVREANKRYWAKRAARDERREENAPQNEDDR